MSFSKQAKTDVISAEPNASAGGQTGGYFVTQSEVYYIILIVLQK